MAAFATMAAAEAFAVAGVEAGTYLVAHSCKTDDGTIAVRAQKPASSTAMGNGGWELIVDDGL